MFNEESLNKALISNIIYSNIQSLAYLPLTALTIVVKYLGVIHNILA